ncbi:MAG TPA: adenosylhomocysteinase [Gaiellaceae bacterium]|nr:adenosylhomocysteinase [Gaiellaceae bacterium]
MATPAESVVLDARLADAGNRKIDWAAQHSPVLNALRGSLLEPGSLAGRRVGVIVPLEAKTAYLALVLRDAGAEVAVTGTSPAYVQDDVAAGLASRGVTVYAVAGVPAEEFERYYERVLEFRCDALIDDRAELVKLAHTKRADLVESICGASEETTSGVTRLRAMEREGVLRFPVVAANNARCKHLFDNRYGTGQSTIASILRNTNLFMAGKEVVVVGYGWCGKGIARRAKGVGARVTVVEVDAVKALEAYADGFEARSLDECAGRGDVFITSTGVPDAIRREHFEGMKDGVILANAGGLDVEIREATLRELAVEEREVRPHITEFTMADRRRLHLLAHGNLVNIAPADGHPVEIMDLTFAVQALACRHVLLHHEELAPGVHEFPAELDEEIARLKLASLGMGVGALTREQAAFLETWE